MVDALRRACRMVAPAGCVIDVHPTARPASLDVDGAPLGPLDAGDASERHAAAGAALATCLEEGLFQVITEAEFVFHTYGDTIEELRDHIAANWRTTRIRDEMVDRARAVIDAGPAGVRPRVTEHVCLSSLRPVP